MGVSTDAIVFYGWLISEGDPPPWIDEYGNDEPEQWWRKVNGYKEPFQLYDEDGEYMPGLGEADSDRWYSHRDAWDKEHPVPFELVVHCSDSCQMYGIAVPGSVTACRGYPEKLDLSKPTDNSIEAAHKVLKKHHIKVENEEPRWWLVSYWG